MDANIEISSVNHLEEALKVLTSPVPNNEQIKKVTELIKKYRKKVESVESFLFIIKNNPVPQIRQLSAILLKRKIDTHWNNLEEGFRNQTIALFIELITNEKEFLVSKAIANVIFKVARVTMISEDYNSLHDYIFSEPDKYSENQAHLFELNLYIISELIEFCYQHIKPKLGLVNNIVKMSLTRGTNRVSIVNMTLLYLDETICNTMHR